MGSARVPRAFAMADIAGSSRLWSRYPDRMSVALARHDATAGAAVRDHGGEIFKHTGDGFIASFTDPRSATVGMIAYQHALMTEGDDALVELRSRVGIHFGSAEPRDGDWFGPTINQLARLTDLVAPTHVVLSGAAAERLDGETPACDHLGDFTVRDSPDPVPLYAARIDGAVGPALTVAAGRGLPRFQTELIGRDADIERVLEVLERQRLVTVLGFGGMGKTRLAVEVARPVVRGASGSGLVRRSQRLRRSDGRHLRRASVSARTTVGGGDVGPRDRAASGWEPGAAGGRQL